MRKLFLLALTCALAFNTAFAQEFNDKQKSEIESIIAEYVSNHPEIVIKALQKYEADEQNRHLQTVRLVGESFRKNKDLPMIGDEKAQHYIIDFYDYNCGYCKVMEPLFKQALKEFNLQLVYVDLPVVTETSQQIAVIAQALYNLDKEKFFAFHDHFMSKKDRNVPLETIQKKIKELGVNWDDLLTEMQSGRPQTQISEVFKASAGLGIRGTPYLIIDGKEFRGAIRDYDDLKALLSN